MHWVILLIAGLFEVCWAVGLKYTDGFTKLVPSALTLGAMAISLYLLSLALRTLPLGTAYAIWTGIGTVGTIIFGIVIYKESADILRILCLSGIVLCILGLKVLSKQ